ncbi:DUF4431 domain-containing protein [Treponema sp. OMZ 906]|uniref:DUF4431 domain-containing protein n=1 Tax=Treponema sp. OMZ 906 TaxID=2563662 RepID=UPI0020A36047|nr:DUF4431 domain-containing protein [Treponema sp. OMZ 906]UTC55951.1 DUF4431 domain-containing protein [Treponema sp. OMZ 906]
MKKVFLFLFFLIQTVLSFSQEKKAFIGTIIRENFFKETTEIKNTESEIYWLLYCDDITKRQLVFRDGDNGYLKYRKYLDKKVIVFGEVMNWETAHHKTKELIIVKNMKEIDETGQEIYKYISNNVMKAAQSVILETTNDKIDISKIKIVEDFGNVSNPFTGEYFYRDFIAYPYYSIRKFGSAIDGEIVEISKTTESSIIIKSGDLEIEYFGWITLDENLKVGDKILKGTFLGTLYGGGDSGMKLKIRMKYKDTIINPSLWF